MFKIAVIYLTVFALAGTLFVFCSFWVYHYVESDVDGEEDVDSDDAYNERDRNQLGLGNMLIPFGEGGPSKDSTTHHRHRVTQDGEQRAEH